MSLGVIAISNRASSSGGGGELLEYYTYRVVIPADNSGTYPFDIERYYHKGDTVINDIPYKRAGNYAAVYNDGVLRVARRSGDWGYLDWSNVSGITSSFLLSSGALYAAQGSSNAVWVCIPINFSLSFK